MSSLGRDFSRFIGRIMAAVIVLATVTLILFTWLIIRGSLG